MIREYNAIGLESLNNYIKLEGIKKEDIILLKKIDYSFGSYWYTLTYWENIK